MTVEEYIEAYTRRCSNEYCNEIQELMGGPYAPWLTPDHARSVAVIAKEEAIKKAVEWLDDNAFEYVVTKKMGIEDAYQGYNIVKLVNDFKQAMLNEK